MLALITTLAFAGSVNIVCAPDEIKVIDHPLPVLKPGAIDHSFAFCANDWHDVVTFLRQDFECGDTVAYSQRPPFHIRDLEASLKYACSVENN